VALDTGGTTTVQLPSTGNAPIFQATAKGSKRVAAGTRAIQAKFTVGGGGATISITNFYGEAEQVGP
jgi:hypothetical protein